MARTQFCSASFLVACLSLTWLPFADAADGNFAQFRGGNGSGVAEAAPSIPTKWSAESGEGIAWTRNLPGSGWSQPVIWEGRLYVTAAVAEKDLKPKNFAAGVRTPQSMGMGFLSKAPKVDVDWVLYCLDCKNGEIIWKQTVCSGKPKYAVHPSNSYATETPVVGPEGVVAYFGATGEIAAFKFDGTPIWQRNFGAHKTSNSFGTGSSLAKFKSLVFLQDFSEETADLHALEITTGKTRWTKSRSKPSTSWSSPLVWNNSMRSELVTSGGQRIDSFNPETGELLWTLSNVKAATACSICCSGDSIFFGGSDPFSTGPLFAVKAGGSGDVSPAKMNADFDLCAWQAKKSAPGMSSPVANDARIFIADKNILRSYDVKSGERQLQTRLPDLGMVNACPLMLDGKILLVDESGKCLVVQAADELKVVASGQLDDTVWATPAVSQDGIFIRGVDALYCIKAQ